MEAYSDYFETCQDVIDFYHPDMSENYCAADAQCGFCEESYMDYTDYPYPNALDGLKQFFGYNSDAIYIGKEDHEDGGSLEVYSDADWINMLKNQLDQGYPLIHVGYKLYEEE